MEEDDRRTEGGGIHVYTRFSSGEMDGKWDT